MKGKISESKSNSELILDSVMRGRPNEGYGKLKSCNIDTVMK